MTTNNIDDMITLLTDQFVDYLKQTASESNDTYEWKYFQTRFPDKYEHLSKIVLHKNNPQAALLKTIEHYPKSPVIHEMIEDFIGEILSGFVDKKGQFNHQEFNQCYKGNDVFDEVMECFVDSDTIWLEKKDTKIVL